MACTRLPLLASECGHSLCTRQTQAAKPEPLSHLQIAKAQVNLLSRERDELRGMVAKLEFAAAGQKRKACSDVSVSSTRTRDPRKRPRVLSPEEQLISDLKGQLSKATEESKERRDADARELASVQTCLKDMVGKTSANQELIRKLEADLDLKEKAVESKTNELSAAVTTISKLKNRVSYLEHDRQHLKADVSRYRARICKNQMQAPNFGLNAVAEWFSGITNPSCAS
ncbi:hypothetical protein DFH08DRAFT_932942 [Mycena albidolilacea]|uniref:Uncharacterized protein n=1 Tax=Mycena albidolilacea TaxID=1033008 RepID=A0AAD7AG62_9AGAR|nr:hypothetical protein DFH08DRAFT_932942 [Mycena albidolilacea]